MRISLICSKNLRAVLEELIAARGIEIDDASDICIVESGLAFPENKLIIFFNSTMLDSLVELLNKFAKAGEDDRRKSIVGKKDEKYEIIPYERIHFFESRGNTIFCVTADGEYRIKEKLYLLEEILPAEQFIRVNKSFIVNITNVKEILPWFGRRLILRFFNSSKEVDVSRNYIGSFKEFLGM